MTNTATPASITTLTPGAFVAVAIVGLWAAIGTARVTVVNAFDNRVIELTEVFTLADVLDVLAHEHGLIGDSNLATLLGAGQYSVPLRLAVQREGKIARIKRFREAAQGIVGLKLAKDIIEAIDGVGRDASIEAKAAAVAPFLVHPTSAPTARGQRLAAAWIEIAEL
jgi:ribosomal protein L7/L12